MTLLALGLCLFAFPHLMSATVLPRRLVVARIGENAYRGLFTLMALGGIAVIVWGWRHAGTEPLFTPVTLAWKTAPFVVSLAIILIVAAQIPSHIRRVLRHPMLLGVALWSANHVIGGGSVRQTLLFGGFLAFALFELVSLSLRGKRATFTPQAKYDVIALLLGIGIATAVITVHTWAFGLPAWYF